MTALYVGIEPADDPDFVSLRTSTSPNPERKPAMVTRRDCLDNVLLMLLDAACTDAEPCFAPCTPAHCGGALDVGSRAGA